MARDFDPEYERQANEKAKAFMEQYEKEQQERLAREQEMARDYVKEMNEERRREQARQAKAERERQRRRKKNKKKKKPMVTFVDKLEEGVAEAYRILFK